MEQDNVVLKNFLQAFTKEIILSIKVYLDLIEKERLEKERVKKLIEIEKLKYRFSLDVENIKKEEKELNLKPAVVELKEESKSDSNNEQRLEKSAYTPIVLRPSRTFNLIKQQRPIQQPRPQLQKIQEVKGRMPGFVRGQESSLKTINTKPLGQIITKIEVPKTIPEQGPNDIKFGKIYFLIRDPLVTFIECPGPNKNIVIKKAGNKLVTQITFLQAEIVDLINSFSEVARIPLIEGILTARHENLEISAVVSDEVTPSFVIKKDIIPQFGQAPTNLMPNNPHYNRNFSEVKY
jgi:hypothetical protein